MQKKLWYSKSSACGQGSHCKHSYQGVQCTPQQRTAVSALRTERALPFRWHGWVRLAQHHWWQSWPSHRGDPTPTVCGGCSQRGALWQFAPPKTRPRGCSSSTPIQTAVFSAPGCFTFLEYYHRLKSPCSTYQRIHCALWVSNDHYVLFSLFELKHISF